MNREKIILNMHDLNRKNGLCKRENNIYIFFVFIFLLNGEIIIVIKKNILTNTPMGYIIHVETRNFIMEEKECCLSHKTKERSEKEYKSLINRLNRIEGQVRGIKSMVEKNAYCTDILIQISAVSAALNAFNKELLANHIKSCVADDIRAGNDEKVNELISTLHKLMK